MRFLSPGTPVLKRSIALRVAITTILLGSGAFIYYVRGARKEALYLAVIVSVIYLVSLLYFLFQSFFESYPKPFKIALVVMDLILSSAVIYLTGGRSSPFIFLYVLIIIYSSISLSKTACYATAIAAGALYIFILYYQTSLVLDALTAEGVLPQASIWHEIGLVSVYFHITGFLLIAILGAYLSERIQKTGIELGEREESLKSLQNLHENILQSLTSGVITLDLDGAVISVNKMGVDILGVDYEKTLLGQHITSFLPGLSVSDFLLKTREQIMYIRPEGERLTLGFSCSELKDSDGNVQGYIIIFQDLTNIKQLEERLRTSEKMAILGQLAAGLAHELRNPLSAISGAVEILSAETSTTDENSRLVKMATQQIDRLNLLVEDFLILTMPIQKLGGTVDLGLIIYETVESFGKTIQRKNITIDNKVKKGLMVQAESYRLKQAIWNLLLNSVDAMPEGGKIELSSRDESGNIVIELSDDGHGIDEQIISRLFDPFFTTKEVGTGLGLAIVQKVIEGYNGTVNIISSKGDGATFVITLPRFKRVSTDTVH